MTHHQQQQPAATDSVSAILEEWRRAERELVAMNRAEADRPGIEAEIARLRGEYQRLVEPKFQDADSAADGIAPERTARVEADALSQEPESFDSDSTYRA